MNEQAIEMQVVSEMPEALEEALRAKGFAPGRVFRGPQYPVMRSSQNERLLTEAKLRAFWAAMQRGGAR